MSLLKQKLYFHNDQCLVQKYFKSDVWPCLWLTSTSTITSTSTSTSTFIFIYFSISVNTVIVLYIYSPNKRNFWGPCGVVRGLDHFTTLKSVRGSVPLLPSVVSRCLLVSPVVSRFCSLRAINIFKMQSLAATTANLEFRVLLAISTVRILLFVDSKIQDSSLGCGCSKSLSCISSWLRPTLNKNKSWPRRRPHFVLISRVSNAFNV